MGSRGLEAMGGRRNSDGVDGGVTCAAIGVRGGVTAIDGVRGVSLNDECVEDGPPSTLDVSITATIFARLRASSRSRCSRRMVSRIRCRNVGASSLSPESPSGPVLAKFRPS